MGFSKRKNILIALIMTALLAFGIYFVFQQNSVSPASRENTLRTAQSIILAKNTAQSLTPIPLPPPQKLANPPKIINAIYATGYSAGLKSYVNYLSKLFKETEINAVVIDLKGSDGRVMYASGAEDVKKYNLNFNAISNIDSLVRFLHSQNVYIIGRIVVFEDPVYSKSRPELAIYDKAKSTDLNRVLWKDNHGLSWLDPSSKDVWEYEVSLSKDALNNHGFDEINFDYVRFPTDGNMENLGYPVYDGTTPKAEIINQFFQYLRAQLPGEKLSVDLFGQTTVNTDDMGIGQTIESAFENFDYLSPMVYPSHYINGFDGFQNPADHPYEVIKYCLDKAIAREPLAKFRPWLQDFNMGAYYTSDMVSQEIKATQDSLGDNYNGYMLWNPNNIYTEGAITKLK